MNDCYAAKNELRNFSYKVYCLDGGAWDRPSLIGSFDTQEQAIDFIKK